MTYTVTFKRGLLKKTLKNVKGDGFTEHFKSRFFILDDETRIEIPVEDTIFVFSKERFLLIHQRMEAETGQNIKMKPR